MSSIPANISNAIFGVKMKVKSGLNKPGRRWLLTLLASLYAVPKTQKFMKIYYDEGVWIHKSRSGVIVDRRINYTSSLCGYEVSAKDNWEFVYKPKPGDIVLDIGAGVGSDTYYFSKAVGPSGKVVSIEAHPQTFQCLKKLCLLNALDNVILENIAIGDKESEIFITDDEQHISSTTLKKTSGGIKVKSVTLDFLMEELGILGIDFIKMNIEGAEKAAIRGMAKAIKRTKFICISCHDFKADRDGIDEMRSKDVVQEFLSNNGFMIIPRKTDKRPWIRDQLNGLNNNIYF